MTISVGGGWYQEVDLHEGEMVVDEQGARYGQGIFAWRGKLYLTTERLIFCPGRIGPRKRPLVFDLSEIKAIGTSSRGRLIKFLALGRNTDSWFIEHAGERHWFDLGRGWNQMWAEKFAKRLGVPCRADDERG